MRRKSQLALKKCRDCALVTPPKPKGKSGETRGRSVDTKGKGKGSKEEKGKPKSHSREPSKPKGKDDQGKSKNPSKDTSKDSVKPVSEASSTDKTQLFRSQLKKQKKRAKENPKRALSVGVVSEPRQKSPEGDAKRMKTTPPSSSAGHGSDQTKSDVPKPAEYTDIEKRERAFNALGAMGGSGLASWDQLAREQFMSSISCNDPILQNELWSAATGMIIDSLRTRSAYSVLEGRQEVIDSARSHSAYPQSVTRDDQDDQHRTPDLMDVDLTGKSENLVATTDSFGITT